MRKILSVIVFSALSIAVFGCSNKNDESNAKTTSNSIKTTTNNGDKKFPTEKYQLIDSYKKMMFIGMGLEQSIDYEYAVSMLSKKYQNENDAFKKKEIYENFKSTIDSEINIAKLNKYYKIELPAKYLLVQPYDFKSKSFKMQSMEVINGYYLFDDANKYSKFSFNESGSLSVPVSDESIARIIEEKRSKNEEIKIVAYIYINKLIIASGRDDRGLPTPANPIFISELMHVKILDKNDVLLAEI